jgi:hypothetical protein
LIGAFTYVSHPTQVVRNANVAPETSLQTPTPTLSPKTIVGHITDMANCVWDGTENDNRGHHHSRIGNRKSSVVLGDRFALCSGLLEITYHTGAKVILQGPVTYEVESKEGGYLAVGKLTARVEQGSRNKAQGYKSEPSIIHHPLSAGLFFVRTPTAIVTDLGTEFGVEVDKTGGVVSHVFRGSIRMELLASDGKSVATRRILHANESAWTEGEADHRRVVVQSVSSTVDSRIRNSMVQRFVREIPKGATKTLDLADVVAGGDGYLGKRNRGIDPTNGESRDKPLATSDFILIGDGKYHRVPGVRFVDGVFVPDFRRGPVQIDSAGHTFDGYAASASSMNQTSGYVWAGAAIPMPASAKTVWTYSFTNLPVLLDGIDYTKPDHGLLCLHPNKGITFDLEAIRQANPGWDIVRFQAATANVETGVANTEGVADIRVFVDGETRFQRRETGRSRSAFQLAIPIGRKERFLTLMTTDGGDTFSWDWVVFGDPRLELQSQDSVKKQK